MCGRHWVGIAEFWPEIQGMAQNSSPELSLQHKISSKFQESLTEFNVSKIACLKPADAIITSCTWI